LWPARCRGSAVRAAKPTTIWLELTRNLILLELTSGSAGTFPHSAQDGQTNASQGRACGLLVRMDPGGWSNARDALDHGLALARAERRGQEVEG
jgi:hypothetical protein